MRGKQARRLRKMVYTGDLTSRHRMLQTQIVKTILYVNKDGSPVLDKEGKQKKEMRGMIYSDERRRLYQQLKAKFKRGEVT